MPTSLTDLQGVSEVAPPHEEVVVQSGARSRGIHGIYGNGGNVESATYRNHRVLSGSNPTLSANMSFFVLTKLASDVGSPGAMRLFFAVKFSR